MHDLVPFVHLKNMKKHEGVLLLVILQAEACNFTKSNTLPWVFSCFLNSTNSTKSRKASQMIIEYFNFSWTLDNTCWNFYSNCSPDEKL